MQSAVVFVCVFAFVNCDRTAWYGTCGVSKYADAGETVRQIENGQDARRHEWPWQVIFRRYADNFMPCGGYLIHPNWTLTAAHCVNNLDPENPGVFIVAGEHDVREGAAENPVRQHRHVHYYMVHEMHNLPGTIRFEHDIALMRHDPVDFNENVTAVCAPEPNNTYADEMSAISGFGSVRFGGPMPSVMLYARLPVLNHTHCQSLTTTRPVSTRMICAGQYPTSSAACSGDSGGPMVVRETEGDWTGFRSVGVCSWGFMCASRGMPSYYTRLSEYVDWVTAKITKNP